MANKITVTPNENTITITESPNSVNLETTVTPVTVTQVSTNYVQVNTDIGPAGPIGPQGPAASTGSLVTTASISDNVITFTKGNESTFDITIESSSFATTSSRALTSNTSETSDKVYINFETLDTISRIPTVVGYADGSYQLKSPNNEIIYYQRVGNPVTGATGTQSDYLFIGGGSNTAGGVYLNSTVTRNNFVYSDYNAFYIRAGGGSTGDLHLEAHNDIHVSASQVFIESNIGNSITASNDISASGDIFGTTGSFEGGLILTAPNGNRFRVNVSNTGVINTNGPI